MMEFFARMLCAYEHPIADRVVAYVEGCRWNCVAREEVKAGARERKADRHGVQAPARELAERTSKRGDKSSSLLDRGRPESEKKRVPTATLARVALNIALGMGQQKAHVTRLYKDAAAGKAFTEASAAASMS